MVAKYYVREMKIISHESIWTELSLTLAQI